MTRRAGHRYTLDDQPVVGFCSNDYLGLASTEMGPLGGAARGSTASRLVCGDHPAHQGAEASLAALCDTQDAVLFPSGYQLNVGVLARLCERGDVVYSDALNHASLIDGLRLSNATIRVLEHGAPPPADIGTAHTWWVTESVFSMDGDGPQPQALARHLEGGGHLYLDEAHAIGLHAGGRGLASHHGIHPTVLVGTLGKAFGASGAFVAASHTVCEIIRTQCRSFVFSTGTSPALAQDLVHAITLVRGPEGDARRARLWSNVERLATALDDPQRNRTPIFPIVVGTNEAALEISRELVAKGFHVQPIRPPTVPPGTARLRVTVSAEHEPHEIDGLLDALRHAFDQRHLPLKVQRGLARPIPEQTREVS